MMRAYLKNINTQTIKQCIVFGLSFLLLSSYSLAGNTPTNDPTAIAPDDDKECEECEEKKRKAKPKPGMPVYHVHSTLVSLNIEDRPLSYVPDVGPDLPIIITYNQKDNYQPSTFNFSNLGPKWNVNWQSYIKDNGTVGSSATQIYLQGGGVRDYSGYSSATQSFTVERKTGIRLVVTSQNPIRYERRFTDGEVHVYGADNGLSGSDHKVFLTEVIDKVGRKLSFEYDTSTRLMAIVDATKKRTTFDYNEANKPLLVSQINDPFGRSAKFTYDASGRLASITDAVGLTSSFTYEGSDTFINSMTTPYGTTQFSYVKNGTTMTIVITDPEGQKERVTFEHSASGVSASVPSNQVPTKPGSPALMNAYLNLRNTYYWDKTTMATMGSSINYNQAKITHWLHNQKNETANVKESMVYPDQSRVWYAYSGQTIGYTAGTNDFPIYEGRVLPDGTTQATLKTYNDIGKVLTETAPNGTVTTYTYAGNDIDLLKIEQRTKEGLSRTVASFTYNDNHLPLTMTDAKNQTTRYEYNAIGQTLSITTPTGKKTSYAYNGIAQRISESQNGQTTIGYQYDEAGRIKQRTTYNADSGNLIETMTYDDLDRLLTYSTNDGHAKTLTYDKLDLATVTDSLGRKTTYTYDKVRRLTKTQLPNGDEINYEYDPNGRVTKITQTGAPTKIYAYNLMGQVTEEAVGSLKQTHTYDNAGRRIKTVKSDGQTIDYTLDVSNQIVQTKDDAANLLSQSYDGFLRPKTRSLTDGIGALAGNNGLPAHEATQTLTYAYNELDEVTSVTDALERVTAMTYNGDGQIKQLTNALNQVTQYDYDERGRLNKTVSPLLAATFFGYNNQNVLKSVTDPKGVKTDYTHTKSGDLATEKSPDTGETKLGYGPEKERVSTTDANGNVSAVKHDELGRMTEEAWSLLDFNRYTRSYFESSVFFYFFFVVGVGFFVAS